MHILSKQLSFLLLSWVTIIFSQPSLADYTNPFIPVYSKGDDISYAAVKPDVIYESIKSSEVVIPNMPAYKTQDGLGECRAFSLATLIQKYTCDKWKSDIPNCKNPPTDSAISYFGMLAYTNRNVDNTESLQPNQDKARSMMNIINDLSTNGNQLILESCKPFDTLVNSFDMQTLEGRAKRDQFLDYLKNLYTSNKSATEANITDCPECVNEINKAAGLNTDLSKLKKALAKDTYDKFLYALFFSGCKFENFPAGFSPAAYPADSLSVTPKEIKLNVISGLKLGKPVMLPSLCAFPQVGDDCKSVHAIVVSGFKTVCNPIKKTECRDLFKVHNSWGAEWQQQMNDGWVDADQFTSNTSKIKANGKYRIASASVIWLAP